MMIMRILVVVALQTVALAYMILDRQTMLNSSRVVTLKVVPIDPNDMFRGEYVILSEDEIKEAYPKTTQTIEIQTFVKAEELSFAQLERPYFTAPVGKGDKAVEAALTHLIRRGTDSAALPPPPPPDPGAPRPAPA